MANIKKVVKGVKKVTKKKPLTPKQKTYQVRGAIAKLEKEVEAKGGKPSPQRIADLKAQLTKTMAENKTKPYKGSKQY
jgi:hypothetical protein